MSKTPTRHASRKHSAVRKAPASRGAGANIVSQKKLNVSTGAITTVFPSPSLDTTVTRKTATKRRQADQMRYLVQRRARRNAILAWTAGLLLLAVTGGLLAYFVFQSHQARAQHAPSPYTEPIFNSAYPPVDDVYCDQLEMQAAHIHAHLSIWINGKLSPLPQGVGIPIDQQSDQPTCFYWLHTHDNSGVIHIEAPVQETFTLGQFFDEWNQQIQSLGFPSELLLGNGWTSWVNGQPFHGRITTITLAAHALITLAFNSPNVKPEMTYSWNGL